MSALPPTEPPTPDPWSYPSEPAQFAATPPDLLISPGEAAAQRPRRRRWPIVVAIAAVVALLLGGAAFAGARLWYGSGAQPEDATPSTVVAFARLDLSPGYGQRLAVNNLLKKFPRKDGKDAVDELKKSIFDAFDVDETAYRKNVEPWFAERIGAGLWLGAENQPYALITVAVQNEKKARAGLAEVQRDKGGEKFGFVVRTGYALVAYGPKGSQTAAEAAGRDADRETLAAQSGFRGDLERLPDRQTALGWVDLGKLGAAMKTLTSTALDAEQPADGAGDSVAGSLGPLAGLVPGMGQLSQADALTGRLILGARATEDGVEIHFRNSGSGAGSAPVGPADARSTADALPANSAIAGVLRAGDLSKALPGAMTAPTPVLPEEMFEGLPADQAKLLREQVRRSQDHVFGLTKGIAAASGAKVTLSVSKLGKDESMPTFTGSAETTSADKATVLADAVKLLGDQTTVTTSGTTVEVKSTGYTAEGGPLRGQALYRQALAGTPEKATSVVYVDVQRLLADADLTQEERAQSAPIKAVGLATAVDGADQVGVLRLIIK